MLCLLLIYDNLFGPEDSIVSFIKEYKRSRLVPSNYFLIPKKNRSKVIVKEVQKFRNYVLNQGPMKKFDNLIYLG
jgi:hypothetical protein